MAEFIQFSVAAYSLQNENCKPMNMQVVLTKESIPSFCSNLGKERWFFGDFK